MIQRTKSFTTSDNQSFLNLEDAQKHELETLFQSTEAGDAGPARTAENAVYAVAFVMKNAERVIDILTTKGNSRAKARKVNKKAKPATQTATA